MIHNGHIQNGKILWTWVVITVFFVGLVVSTGLKWNQIDRNVQEIQVVGEKADENEKQIIRFEGWFNNIDEALKRIEDKIK